MKLRAIHVCFLAFACEVCEHFKICLHYIAHFCRDYSSELSHELIHKNSWKQFRFLPSWHPQFSPELSKSLGVRCESFVFGWIFSEKAHTYFYPHKLIMFLQACDDVIPRGRSVMQPLICRLLELSHVLRVRHILKHLWGPPRENPSSSVQTDLCIRNRACSALWAQTSELSSSLWKCLCKRPVPPTVCIRVCVIQTINIQHVQWRNMLVKS